MGRPENAEQRQAFEVYLNLGAKRGINIVAREVNRDPHTVMDWKNKYFWDDRVKQAEEEEGRDKLTTLPKTLLPEKPQETEMQGELRTLVNIQYKALLDALEEDPETGELTPKFKITKMSEFIAVSKSFRETVEVYHKLTRVGGGEKGAAQGKLIDLVKTLIKDGMSKEASIEFLKSGQVTSAGVNGGDITAPGRVSEGDFKELPDEGNDESNGGSGVSGSTGETDSGDEGEVREPGTPVDLRDFVQSSS